MILTAGLRIDGFTQNIIADSSFELGTPNVNWAETSTNFNSVICDATECGDCSGLCVPKTGDFFAWFGGDTTVGISVLSQNVLIPSDPGSTFLKFHLKVPEYNSLGTDSFRVIMDDTSTIFLHTNADSLIFQNYRIVVLDITAYADSTTHNIKFRSWVSGFPGATNVLVDDVRIDQVAPLASTVTADAGEDIPKCINDSITIGGLPTANGGTAAYTYSWTPTADLNDPSLAYPLAFPSVTTEYILVVTEAGGSTDTDTMTVEILGGANSNC